MLDLKKKRKRYAIIPWIYEFGLFEEAEHEITSMYQFLVAVMNSFCEFLLEPGRTKSTLIGLSGPRCSSPRTSYCNNYGYNLYHDG